MPEENTKVDSELEDKDKKLKKQIANMTRVIPDSIVMKYGYTKQQDPLYMQHPSGARVKLNVIKYDVFKCKACKVDYAFLLPADAIPCHLHTDNICCSCCMRNGTSNYCIGKKTSYVMAR